MTALFHRWTNFWRGELPASQSDASKTDSNTQAYRPPPPPPPPPPKSSEFDDFPRASPRGMTTPTLKDISITVLREQRMSLDNAQRDALNDLQGLEADRQGLVARYAEVRLSGTKVALAAIERQYKSLQSRIRHLEKRHDQLNKLLQLLQETEEIKETHQWRESKTHGGVLNIDLHSLTGLLEQAVADDLKNDKLLDELLYGLDNESQKAAMAREGSSSAARQELMDLSETEVQRASTAQLMPLEQAADLFDQSMAHREDSLRQRTGAAQ